jgi:hypothetical protein
MKRTIFLIPALAGFAMPLTAIMAQSDGTAPVKPPVGQTAQQQQSSQESQPAPVISGSTAIPNASGTSVEQSGTNPQTSGTDPIIPVPHMSK